MRELVLKLNILNTAVNITFLLLEIFLSIGLLLAIFNLFKDLYISFPNSKDMFNILINSSFSIFILLEIIKSINEYFQYKRIKITTITEITIIFIMREIIIGLYQHSLKFEDSLYLSIVLLILTLIRILSVKFSPINIERR
ncbi:hypothetical protein JCM14244_14230 [Venenivibrio stagnispumantis]|uniref:Uncharacterized membrane protein, DUF373 family n=1 Tax=Venenivibrio stagnispumantis TaxID=407998 RepID=A0AA45WL78_9AQUI|nr:phosphate-starvation-inducible PsiE family protein [Venenivibrio stagnispumantis]MCW4573690.1 phosphate-starvation-inducible PsiE family protein [Venenivibrio stagnispumantis]SMP10012.1 Uncharacterized membrane protein, DUF373 family [Venenivibrio stagnispumantis]